MELMEEYGKVQLNGAFAGNSETEVMEAIFKLSEFLHFYIAKVKNQQPYNYNDELSWPSKNSDVAEKFKMQS